MKKISKETVQNYLEFKLNFEDTKLEEISKNWDPNDGAIIPEGNYFDYFKILYGIDLYLTECIDLKLFTNWSNYGCSALFISLRNNCIVDEEVFYLWEQFNDEVLNSKDVTENDIFRAAWCLRNNIRLHFTIEQNDETKNCYKIIDKFEKKKTHTEKEITDYINALLKLGEYGDAEAINYVGTLYYSGRIVKQDFEKAKYYYSVASLKECPQATINLGYIYYYARCGGEPDYENAFECFSNAMNIGDMYEEIEAGYKLFDFYFHGHYVEKDVEKCKRILDLIYKDCKELKKRDGSCQYLGDIYMRYARLYSKDGLKDDPFERRKYLLKAQKEIKARWDGVWFGDKKLLDECEKEISICNDLLMN